VTATDALFWFSPFVLVPLALMVLVAIVLVRIIDQAHRDHNRRTYRLSFPAELTNEHVLSFVYAISGTLRPLPLRLLGTPNVVLEVLATDQGIAHRLQVPWPHGGYVLDQLRSLVPGIRVSPEEHPELPEWTRISELGQTNITRTLRIRKPEPVSTSLLASMQGIGHGEAVLLQWVISPSMPTKPPRPPAEQRAIHRSGLQSRALTAALNASIDRDKIADQREKLEEPNLSAVVRVAARATTQPRANHLVFRVRAALASVRTPHTRFRQSLILPSHRLAGRVRDARGPIVFPIHVTASELVPLIAWPIGEPHIAGLPQTRSRHLAPSNAIARHGRIVAASNFPGAERPLAITRVDSCKHLHVVGPTGVGKTTLLANLVAQDMAAGAGIVLMESKGDLFREALSYVPRSRIRDVVVLDVTDLDYPVGFNVLAQGRPQVVASDLQGVFNALYGRSGVRVPESLFHGLMTLLTSQAATWPMTFVDLVPLFSPMGREEQAFSDALIRGVLDPYIRNFWQQIDNMSRSNRDTFFGPIMERIWQLNNRPEIRNIIGQSRSSFDIAEVVKQRKILLVNLSGLGVDTASLLGTLIVNALWHAVKGGAADPEHPTFLYLDEFQDYLNLPISPGDMLAQSRSFGLAMTLAHQHLEQLPTELRSAVLSNARSKVVFQTSSADAKKFAEEFGSQVSVSDFMNLGRYEVICRLAGVEGVSQPVTGMTREPAPKHNLELQVREYSRHQYGRPVHEVDEEIAVRRSAAEAPGGKRPRLGGLEWNEVLER
jgi:Type IV secretion-system coupling protein DNA-binding domain